MSDIRESLENIGRRFSPPAHSVEKIVTRARGMRRRRLLGTTLAIVLAGVPLSAGAWALLVSPPDCPPVAEGGYQLTMAPRAGAPGTEVTLSGPVPLFREDGSYGGTDDQIDFWWNVDPDQWFTAMPGHDPGPAGAGGGSTTFLGSEELGDSCRFEFVFQVPDYQPGDYPVIGLIQGGGGGGLYGGVGVEFHVND